MFTHLYQRQYFKEAEVRVYGGEIVLALEHLHKVGEGRLPHCSPSTWVWVSPGAYKQGGLIAHPGLPGVGWWPWRGAELLPQASWQEAPVLLGGVPPTREGAFLSPGTPAASTELPQMETFDLSPEACACHTASFLGDLRACPRPPRSLISFDLQWLFSSI